ncbi:hypothetical protein WL80_02405 [Burkholderia ubonensis]|uniref:hypothetical protein n=1 Tax=Burkholderia ubonensis TaxID=101571 RepID=UPI00075962C2|nr:hypothetical protein [Burkholderia ubonensis]KVL65147.1 hypothetical protein WJ48_19020 [Burkholderia ubonensis]KVL79919.1 hypothetical protein WJ49_06950 [Burkholderia ubonensis]KWF00470.1 hypothetical protein WL80_02405 [Burkholderia ubonensis]
MHEFDAILKYLGDCSPYHSDQEKGNRQLKWERAANWIVWGMAACFLVLVALVLWKLCRLPMSNGVVTAALVVGLMTEVLALPWIACLIVGFWIGQREQKLMPKREWTPDIYRRQAAQDEQHARGLVTYSEVVLVRVRHYLEHKVRGLAGIGSIGKVWGPLISLGGGYLLRSQFDPAAIGQYVSAHGIDTVSIVSRIAVVVAVFSMILIGIFALRKRHRRGAYQLSIVDLAIRFKQAHTADEHRNITV